MAIVLTPDMRAIIQVSHLCFAATASPDGRPNLSPKGTIRVWDDSRLFFLDIASPGTRANIAAGSLLELNVVDPLSRRGYRFSGPAAIHTAGDLFTEAVRRVVPDPAGGFAVHGVIVQTVEHASPLVSPGYWHVADEAAMRELWRARRAALDAEFETHLATVTPFRVEH